MEPRPEAIAGIERSLFNTPLDVTGRANLSMFSYQGRVTVFKLLECADTLYKSYPGDIAWLEAAATEFARVLVELDYLSDGEGDLFLMSVEEMKADMGSNKVDLANLNIDDLGIYASPNAALKLSSLHNAKGREYAAVAMIDLREGSLPHYRSTAPDDIAEAKRLFYVGVTRAERFLLYATNNASHWNGPSRFLRAGTGVGLC